MSIIDPNTSLPARSGRLAGLAALVSARDLAAALGVGALLYFGSALVVVGRWEVMPTTFRRLVAINKFLRGPARPAPGGVYLFGSSILHEGVDCALVDEVRGAGSCYNLAWNQVPFRQMLLLLPAAVSTRPGAVVVTADLISATGSRASPASRLTVAAWWDFLTPADREELREVFKPDERRILESGRVEQLLGMRSWPLGALDSYVREERLPNLDYRGFATDFKSPGVMVAAASSEDLERRLERTAALYRARRETDRQGPTRDLAAALAYLRRHRTRAVVVFAPVNPRLAARLGPEFLPALSESLRSVCESESADFWDYSDLLGSDDFADAVHPFAAGRERYSRRLAADLAARLGDQ